MDIRLQMLWASRCFFALGLQFHAARFNKLVGDKDGVVRDVCTWTKKVDFL